jgi:glycosyltransferase involved in cell wall biosynthesis
MKEVNWKWWIIKNVLSNSLVLVQTERIQQDVLSEFPNANLRILGNGVDIPDKTADGDRIIYVGRLREQKGIEVFLRAVENLNEPILIVGDGANRDEIESLAYNLNLDVEFTGEVTPNLVDKYLFRSRIFVLPSVRGEGLPNAVLEAMSAGLPVVVTDTGGAADAVKHGETGFIVSPGDETALRDRIQYLCGHPSEREEMGQRARRHVVKHHRWQRIVSELESIYERFNKPG